MEDKSFSLREIKVMDSWKYTWIIPSWSFGYWLIMMMWVKCLMICDIRNGAYPYDESWSFRTLYIDLFWVICALHESWKKSTIISVMCRYNVYYKNDAFKGFDHRVCKNFTTSEKLSHGSAHGGDVLRVFIPIRVGKRTWKSGCLFCILFWTYVTSE